MNWNEYDEELTRAVSEHVRLCRELEWLFENKELIDNTEWLDKRRRLNDGIERLNDKIERLNDKIERLNMNLDKLLKKVELNKQASEEQKTYPLEIGGETYEVKTLTRAKKREFIYGNDTGKTNFTIGDIVKRSIPYVYISLGLAPLAERAKADKLIVKNYDIVELLFEPDEVMQIIEFIVKINNIVGNQVEEDIEDIKKP